MTAQRTAAHLAPGDLVPWRSLEYSAFEDFPEVVAQLKQPAGDRKSSRKFIYFLPLALLVAVIYGTPIWGLITVVGPWGLSQTSRTAQGDITVASVIFLVALVSLLIHAALWFSSGRPSKTALSGSSGMAIALGGLSTGVTAVRGSEHSVPAWELLILPMLASAVLGGLLFLLVRRARRRMPIVIEPVDAARDRQVSPEDLQGVRESINRVEATDQRVIRDDLVAAIDDLEHRGVITADVAHRARSAELGALGVQMAQSPASDATAWDGTAGN